MIHAYRTVSGILVSAPDLGEGLRSCPDSDWNELFQRDDPEAWLRRAAERGSHVERVDGHALLPLVVDQEVWAAGVTYYRSRTARMEESKQAGGGSFYDRVYEAERPELFFKGNARTVVAPGAPIRVRADSAWNVPEPELVLAISAGGAIIGYTAGNDVSSRDIEGENPLYLPQAKVYAGSCSLGPALLLTDRQPGPETKISLVVEREGAAVFEGTTTLAELKRAPRELVSWLYRDQGFPAGCYLMTGTGVVPADSFTLGRGDRVSITIDGIGTLVNPVA